MSDKSGITVNVRTNAEQVANDIGASKQRIMKFLPEALRQFVGRVIKDLLSKSYPAPNNDPTSGHGNTDAAVQQGEENITKEINSAFTTWDKTKIGDLIMARNEAVLWNLNNPIPWRNPRMQKAWDKQDINYLYNAFKARGWQEPAEVGVYELQPTDELHSRVRDPNSGRILDAVRNNRQLRISVKDRQAIEAFILTKQKAIGTMAGGWVQALTALGIPVQDKFGGNGHGGAEIRDGGLTVKAYNALGDYNGMISSKGIIDQTLKQESDVLQKSLQAEIDKILNETASTKGTAAPAAAPTPPVSP